ncbi:hypothetical protein [Galbitalea soli]|uniref:Glycosyltransferase RgtA/B/C/D-like domain-containing protein n=1 Tax=Galbitalea soli TaxID=1268042 RepID=A0A7C9TRH9_9MICO|nr:hypothetical protein [Galbitalea soli]NEM91342.1 hypothetical protein [Galbitalea soli]NYJ30032.1 hypothetical protein [Galbitalea soli]
MLPLLLIIVVHAAIFLLAGLPAAFSVRGAAEGWVTLKIDAIALGLVHLVLAITLYAWFGWAGPIIIAVLWLAELVFAIVTRAGLPARPSLATTGWRLPLAWVIVALGALALRLREVNFLPWVGDMGAYVNWANEFVRIDQLKASWPPFFSSYLAISSRMFGPEFTAAAVPLCGMLLLAVVARVARRLGAGPWATLATGAVVAVSVHAIWYSSFPASEALNAPVFLLWIGCLLGGMFAERRRLPAWLIAAAVVMASLGLLRGTGPILLAPFIVLAVLAVVVPDWRAMAPRFWALFTASLGGALVSYWYGIERIPAYYIATQVHQLLPGPVFHLFKSLGLFRPTALTAVALVALSAVLCAAGVLTARRFAGRARTTRAPRVLGYVLGGGIAAGILGTVILNAEVFHILLREGLWITVIGVALLFVVARSAVPPAVAGFVQFLGLTAGIFIAIQAYRLKFERGHAFYLYWDRYLMSEVIPLLFVLLGLALTVAWQWRVGSWVSRMRGSSSRLRRVAPAVVAAVLALGAAVPTIPQLVLVEKDTYMAGAYEFQTELNSLVPSPSLPVVWAATSTSQAPGFFFPNTWMAFAKPMERSFGYSVVDTQGRSSDFAPDEVMTAQTLAVQSVCAASPDFVVFETQLGGPAMDARVSSPQITFRPLGQRSSDISLLSEPPTKGDWTHLALTVKAWRVHVDPAATSGLSCVQP